MAKKTLGILFTIVVIGAGIYGYIGYSSAEKVIISVPSASIFSFNNSTNVSILEINFQATLEEGHKTQIALEYWFKMEGIIVGKGTIGDTSISQGTTSFQSNFAIDPHYIDSTLVTEYQEFLNGVPKQFEVEISQFFYYFLKIDVNQNSSFTITKE